MLNQMLFQGIKYSSKFFSLVRTALKHNIGRLLKNSTPTSIFQRAGSSMCWIGWVQMMLKPYMGLWKFHSSKDYVVVDQT
jgi:hypothetical protein